MKKLLLLLSIVFSLVVNTSAQQNVTIFKVTNDVTAFGRTKARDTIVFDSSADEFYKLTATATAVDTLSTSSKKPIAGTGIVPVSIQNFRETNYFRGDASTDRSIRIGINPETDDSRLEKLTSGVWQPDTLEVGTGTIKLGERVGLAAFGHHVATEDVIPNHLHLHAHSVFSDGVTSSDARIIDAYAFSEREVIQPDNTGEFFGTKFEFLFPTTNASAIAKAYFQTGDTISTSPTRIQVFEGTSDTGPRVFNQTYPTSDFTPNSEDILLTNGHIQIEQNSIYFFRIESANAFKLKTNIAGTAPWFAVDASATREDDMLQLVSFDWSVDNAYSFTMGVDWVIYQRKIYVAKETGTQTGDFATNLSAGRWAPLNEFANNLEVNGNFTVKDGTRNRVNIIPSGSTFTSPDGNSTILLNNDGTTISGALQQEAYGDNSHLVMDFPFAEYGSAQHQYDRASGFITATVVGAPITSSTYGKYGSGVLLAASQGWDYTPPASYPTGAAARTVEFWCKPSTVAAGRKTVFSYGSNTVFGVFAVGLDGDEAQLAFFGSNNSSGTTDFVAGEWHLVHATYDGTTAKMYVNNVEKVSVAAPLVTGSVYSVVNGYTVKGVESFQGNTAQLKMYDRVLNENERKTSYLRHGGNAVINTESFKIIDENGDINLQVDSDGTATATNFVGQLTGQADTVATITGLAPDTATTQAAQPNITSLGTLTALQVDNININGNTITSTFGDTTISSADDINLISFDDINLTGGVSGKITLTADTNDIVLDAQGPGIGIQLPQLTASQGLYLDAGQRITNTAPATLAQNSLTLTGTITGATSISSTTFIGDLNGTINTLATGVTQSPSDNSTKMATTAYVDSAVSVEDLWDLTTGTLQNKTGPTKFTFNDGSLDRIRVTTDIVALNSGVGGGELKVTGTDASMIKAFAYAVLSGNSFVVNNGTGGDKLVINSSGTVLSDGTNDRIGIDATKTFLQSEAVANPSRVILADNTASLTDGTLARLDITPTSTEIRSETGNDTLKLDTNVLTYHDATRDRLLIDSSDTKLYSPDGSNDISVNNTNTAVTGDVYVVGNTQLVGGLTVETTTEVFYPPRMTTTQRGNLSTPSNGAMIYNSTVHKFQGYANGAWVDFH